MSCTMKDVLYVLMAIVFLMTTNGQCPPNVGNISITTCRSLASGPRIYVDFNKINQTCECIVTFIGFAGVLLVTAETLTVPSCNTEVVVNGSHRFGCPIPQGASATFKLSLDQSINVQAEYSPQSSTGTFYQCLGFQENGGTRRNVGATCYVPSKRSTGSYTASTRRKISSPSTSTPTKTASISTTTKTASTSPSTKITASLTTTTTIKRSTPPSSSYTVQSTESTSHFTNNNTTDNPMSFATSIAVPYSSSAESTQDDPKDMIYFIAGSVAGGGVVLLTGLMIFIMLKINRARKRGKKDENRNEDGAHTNEVFDYNNGLTENPLYITSESEEETENTPGEQHELGLPNNKPIDPMSVYAAPNKNRNHHQMTNSGDVYAQVYK